MCLCVYGASPSGVFKALPLTVLEGYCSRCYSAYWGEEGQRVYIPMEEQENTREFPV